MGMLTPKCASGRCAGGLRSRGKATESGDGHERFSFRSGNRGQDSGFDGEED